MEKPAEFNYADPGDTEMNGMFYTSELPNAAKGAREVLDTHLDYTKVSYAGATARALDGRESLKINSEGEYEADLDEERKRPEIHPEALLATENEGRDRGLQVRTLKTNGSAVHKTKNGNYPHAIRQADFGGGETSTVAQASEEQGIYLGGSILTADASNGAEGAQVTRKNEDGSTYTHKFGEVKNRFTGEVTVDADKTRRAAALIIKQATKKVKEAGEEQDARKNEYPYRWYR